MELQFTKQAREEYLRIVSIFAEFAGTRYANKFMERMHQRGKALLRHPLIGHPEPLLANRKRDYRSISINKNYYIIYYVTNNIVADVRYNIGVMNMCNKELEVEDSWKTNSLWITLGYQFGL